MLFIIYLSQILISPLLEARAEIQKHFRSFFGSNENFRICFQDLLTFTSLVGGKLPTIYSGPPTVTSENNTESDSDDLEAEGMFIITANDQKSLTNI